jgi:hypothetical protein
MMAIVLYLRADGGFKYTAFALLVNQRDTASDAIKKLLHLYAFKMLLPCPSQTGIESTAWASSTTSPEIYILQV